MRTHRTGNTNDQGRRALPSPGSCDRAIAAAANAAGSSPGLFGPACLALAMLGCSSVFAASVISTVDAGGQRTTSANFAMDGSLGGFGGISTAAPPETVKHGYIGQLTEAANLAVNASPSSANEEAASQLDGAAGLDDATIVALAGGDIRWDTPAWPLAAISAAGVVTAAIVYADTPGTFTGRYLGVAGVGNLLVLDTDPDNFGTYGHDGLPDPWQIRYFGLPPNSNASPTNNLDGDPHDNFGEYVADTDPTNESSYLRICGVSNMTPNRLVYFIPSSTNRVYRLEWGSNLVDGLWLAVDGQTNEVGTGTAFWLTDTNGAVTTRFYRIGVKLR